MTKLQLFQSCLKGQWKTAGIDTQYKITDTDTHRLLSFQGSSSGQDWRDNFTFPVKPYKFQAHTWLAHGGFVRVWKAAQDQIARDVLSGIGDKKLLITGYSHGGGVSILGHEYFWFEGLDPVTDAFAAPRILWLPGQEIRKRFDKLTVYRTRGDIVGHVPPALFGYTHVGKLEKIGPNRMISHKPHYPECYADALKE